MFIIHQWNKQTNKKSYKSPIVHFRIVIHQNHAYINIIKYNFFVDYLTAIPLVIGATG